MRREYYIILTNQRQVLPGVHTALTGPTCVAKHAVVTFLSVSLDGAEQFEPCSTVSTGNVVGRTAPACATLVVTHHP